MKSVLIIIAFILVSCTVFAVEAPPKREICPVGYLWDTNKQDCKKAIIKVDGGYVCPEGMRVEVKQEEVSGSVNVGRDWLRCVYPTTEKNIIR